MLSDDTEHSLIVARCITGHPNDPGKFQAALGKELRIWLAGLPPGIGLATLRGILRLCLGVHPEESGVFSAGNGPAMRSAIIGCLIPDDENLRREYTLKSAVVTHSDPKAFQGAFAIAEIAAKLAAEKWVEKPPPAELESLLRNVSSDSDWNDLVSEMLPVLNGEISLAEHGKRIGGEKGISGYVYHTVPWAIACWYLNFGDFEKTISDCIRGGGDTDTTAAICGALAGITCYQDYPVGWWEKLSLWPVSSSEFAEPAIAYPIIARLLSYWIRNILFFGIILIHCVRRLIPPY